MFKTSSAACQKESEYLLQHIYMNDFLDKSNLRYMKYILGVNKKSSNLAVLGELGRFPLYFSVVLSMLKYWFRIKNMKDGLLYDTYMCNKNMFNNNIECWYLSIHYIFKKLNIHNLEVKLNFFIKSVKQKLCNSFVKFWNTKRRDTKSSKLDTYFKLKTCFSKEMYLSLNNFQLRSAICKIRISAHDLKIERDRYKTLYIERDQRLCKKCTLNLVEEGQHFITSCPAYKNDREIFFKEINCICPNFIYLSNEAKFVWLFTNENLSILKYLGSCIITCLDVRRNVN